MWLLFCLSSAVALEPDVSASAKRDFAERIVVAEVISTEPRWSERHPSDIETVVWLATEAVLKGDAAPLEDVLIEGGQIGERRTGVSGQPSLLQGHRYHLLLVSDFDGNTRVMGASGATRLPSLAPQLWTTNGNDWSWEANPVSDGFVINADSFPDPDGAESAWRLSMMIWNSQGKSRVYLSDRGRTSSLQYGGGDDGENITLFTPVTWDTALAQSRYNSIGDEMIDCDTEFYGENLLGPKTWSTDIDGAPEDAYDFAHTSVHELGHCLGFSHSTDENAIMQSTNTDGTGWERRNLGQDDVQGLQEMYGAGEPVLVVDSATLVDTDGDGLASPQEALTLNVVLRNDGGAPAVAVVGTLNVGDGLTAPTPEATLGDLLPGASTGTVNDLLSFELLASDLCTGDGSVQVHIEDITGTTATHDLDVAGDCPAEAGDTANVPGEEVAGGCACATPGSPGGGWLLALPWLGLVRRRGQRRVRESAPAPAHR